MFIYIYIHAYLHIYSYIYRFGTCFAMFANLSGVASKRVPDIASASVRRLACRPIHIHIYIYIYIGLFTPDCVSLDAVL